MRLDKDTMTGRSLCLKSHQKLTVTVTAFFPPQPSSSLLRVCLFVCPHSFGGCLIQQTCCIARHLMGFHTPSVLWEMLQSSFYFLPLLPLLHWLSRCESCTHCEMFKGKSQENAFLILERWYFFFFFCSLF